MNQLVTVYLDGPSIVDTDGAMADIWDASIKTAYSLCNCDDRVQHDKVGAAEWNNRHSAEAARSAIAGPEVHIVTKVRAETVWS